MYIEGVNCDRDHIRFGVPMTKLSKPYLLYANRDIGHAIDIYTALRDLGIALWFDRRDVPLSSNVEREVERAANSSQCIVFLLSQASSSLSAHVQFARSRLRHGKTVIAILLDEAAATFLPQLPGARSYHLRQGIDVIARAIAIETMTRSERGAVDEASEDRLSQYVFLSYAIEDATHLTTIVPTINSVPLNVWDYRSTPRDYRSLFHGELEEAILGSIAVLAIETLDWRRSTWAPKEYLCAESSGIPIVLVRPNPLSDASMLTVGRNYIDYSNTQVGEMALRIALLSLRP